MYDANKKISRQLKFLNIPTPPRKCKVSIARPKPSGRVLASAESIKLWKKKKQDKINEKEK